MTPLFFSRAQEEQVKNVLAILRCFEVVFGLNVNLAKSTMIGISVEEHLLDGLADILGCKVGSLPTSYLGLPLCIGSASKPLWSPVVEKVELKLASWKAKCLSLGGKLH